MSISDLMMQGGMIFITLKRVVDDLIRSLLPTMNLRVRGWISSMRLRSALPSVGLLHRLSLWPADAWTPRMP